jgi:hypothetical protein
VRSLAVALVLAVLFVAAASRAQEGDAAAHFSRGVTLYDEGRLPQALAEFREAQRIAPSAVILYNIAQVEAEQGHAVEAVAAYEEILATTHTIQPAMRAQIDAALTEQRARISTLAVTTNAPGALIAVDDVDVGTAPLASVRVSAGEHVVTARANGYESVRYRFIVAGGASHVANLTLTLSGAAIGSLRVEGRVPGIEIVVDGVTYGLTPLASGIALPAGSHHVEGRRPAYTLFAQDLVVAPGSESRVSVVVEPDPAAPDSELGVLRLSIPSASTTVRIDGAVADGASSARLSLPAGLHDIDVRAADREPYTTRVDLVRTETYDLRPPYAWTPEARETRIQSAHLQRDAGWGLVVGAGILAIVGAIMTIEVWADYEGHQARVVRAFDQSCSSYHVDWSSSAFQAQCSGALSGLYTFPTPYTFEGFDQLHASFGPRLDSYYLQIGVGAAIAAVGGIGLVTGIVLVATAPSDEAIDRGARASTFRLELAGGPSSLTLRGTF